MWPYKNISREEFEAKKDYVETVLIRLGAMPTKYTIPCNVSSFGKDFSDSILSTRIVYEYKGEYFRVDEVLFAKKPFIVMECADNIEDVLNNCMEDADPFPFDLSDDEMIDQIKLVLD